MNWLRKLIGKKPKYRVKYHTSHEFCNGMLVRDGQKKFIAYYKHNNI